MPITAEIKKDYIVKLAKTGKRADNRKFDEFRNIKIETGIIKKAEGCAKVTIGNTQVVAGIKMDIGTPYPDTPESGVMSTAAELIPMASPDFESGPPREDSIELARVVDRGIRESEIIEVEKLCIVPGKMIWMVFLDIHVIDFDGNLFDAASLASIAALLTTKVPTKTYRENWLFNILYDLQDKDEKIRRYMEKNSKNLLKKLQDKESVWEFLNNNNKDLIDIVQKKYPIAWEYWHKNKDNFDLPLNEKELSISLTSVKFNNVVLIDPSLDEEQIAEARITIATDTKGDIRAMQKGLNGSFTVDEIKKVIKSSVDNSKKIREQLYKSVGK